MTVGQGLNITYGVDYSSVCLAERLENFIMILFLFIFVRFFKTIRGLTFILSEMGNKGSESGKLTLNLKPSMFSRSVSSVL